MLIDFAKNIYNLFLLQLFSHFLIDVWKGKMNVWVPSLTNPANVWMWIIFGLDQLFHQIIIILMAANI